MISVQIKTRFERIITAQGFYRIDVDIIDAVNIEPAVLVFRQKDDTFSHVATVYDMETWPTQPSPNIDFYRGRGAKVFFNTLKDATGFEKITRTRIETLANSWDTILEDFPGVEIVTVVTES